MKLKQKIQTEEKVGERVGARSYLDLITLAVNKQLESGNLSEKEVKILVDGLADDDRTVKTFDGKVKAGKSILLDYAKTHEMRDLQGDESFATVRDGTVWSLLASKAIKILEKEGKLKLLDSVLSVRVVEFRNYLGSDLFERAAEKEEKPFASISLKKKK